MDSERKKSVMVVEREEGPRRTICEFLANVGYDVVDSHSGPDALGKISQEHFDAILADAQMPEMATFDLVNLLRKLCDDTILILLTNSDSDLKSANLTKTAGVFGYLKKPCNLQKIKNILKLAFAQQAQDDGAFISLEGLQEKEVSVLSTLISQASLNAVSGIAGMVGCDATITTGQQLQVPARDVANMLQNPQNTLMGVNLDIEGDAAGNMILIFPPKVAYALIDMIMGNEVGHTHSLEAMGESALKEMGNVSGGFFLNSLADAVGMRLLITTPTLILGKAERILDNVFRPLTNPNAKIFIIEMVFEISGNIINGHFLVMSDNQFFKALTDRVGAKGEGQAPKETLLTPEGARFERDSLDTIPLESERDELLRLTAERINLERTERFKRAEVDQLTSQKKELFRKATDATEAENKSLTIKIQQLDQEIKLETMALKKISDNIRAVDNLQKEKAHFELVNWTHSD